MRNKHNSSAQEQAKIRTFRAIQGSNWRYHVSQKTQEDLKVESFVKSYKVLSQTPAIPVETKGGQFGDSTFGKIG